MMPISLMLLVVYFLLLGTLSLYGVHRIVVMRRFWLSRSQTPHALTQKVYPTVTIQLPLYNEHNVAARIIDAAASMNWPQDRLEIQVLDDSDDSTKDIVSARVKHWQTKGISIYAVRRTSRDGFKAGALANGLSKAKGEFVAIFDADFLPAPQFLENVLPYFIHNGIGMVQARWGHLNAEQNLLTRLSATLLDGHFVLEHTARHRSGRFFNFNGTAGVWRRQCIDDAGGWQHDTITEDLDISYRAQLKGWTFVYLKDLVTLAEVPEHMRAFKTQQFRWAKGTAQTAKKVLPLIWKSPFPLATKAEASIHLTANIAYPLTLILALLMPMTARIRDIEWAQWTLYIDVIAFCITSVSVSAFYWLAQHYSGSSRFRRTLEIPLVLALGIGISVSQSRAVFQGIFYKDATFVRTPKAGDQPHKVYHLPASRISWLEGGLALYCLVASVHLLSLGIWHSVPFLLLFSFGYGYVGLLSWKQPPHPKVSLNWRDDQVDGGNPSLVGTHWPMPLVPKLQIQETKAAVRTEQQSLQTSEFGTVQEDGCGRAS